MGNPESIRAETRRLVDDFIRNPNEKSLQNLTHYLLSRGPEWFCFMGIAANIKVGDNDEIICKASRCPLYYPTPPSTSLCSVLHGGAKFHSSRLAEILMMMIELRPMLDIY
jgi:hypothetical protein